MRAATASFLLGLMALPGCDTPADEEQGLYNGEYRSHGSVCYRRNDYPTLLALNELDLSGTPNISGTDAKLAANGDITVSGSAEVDADLWSRGDVIVNGNPDIYGDIESFSHELQVADDPTMDFARNYNHNWTIPCIENKGSCDRYLSGTDLRLNAHETLTLSTGIYYFSDLQISGQAALETIGNVWIFLDGDASFNGGATWSEDWDTVTLVTNGEHTITINGAASAAMHVFAPHSTVKLAGTSGFAGSVVAEDIVLSGTTDLWLTPGSVAKNCPPLNGNYNG